MVCAKCGFEYPGGFCPNCGTKNEATTRPREKHAESELPQKALKTERTSSIFPKDGKASSFSRNKTYLFLGAIAVVLILVIVLIASLGFGSHNAELASSTSSTSTEYLTEGTSDNEKTLMKEKAVEQVDAPPVLSETELCKLASNYYSKTYGRTAPFVEVDSVSGNVYTIHLYESTNDHISSWGWYTIDNRTGIGNDEITGEEINFAQTVSVNDSLKEAKASVAYTDDGIVIINRIVSSSELGTDYRGSNVDDGDLSSAWVEGVDGIGIGEYIEFYTSSGAEIKTIDIYSGYYMSEDLYDNNGKPTKIKLSSGNRSETIDLYVGWNEPTTYALKKPLISDGVVRLTIMDADEGTEFDDIAISEVIFYRLTADQVYQMQYDYGKAFERSEWILYDAEWYEYSKAELESLTTEELRIARNEILANHGRKFNDVELQTYFDSLSWYDGTVEPDKFDAQMDIILNDVEKKNIETIKTIEALRK